MAWPRKPIRVGGIRAQVVRASQMVILRYSDCLHLGAFRRGAALYLFPILIYEEVLNQISDVHSILPAV